MVGCWRGYLSDARCKLAYGPADATATHLSNCFSKIQIAFTFLLSAYPGISGQRAIKRVYYVCVCVCVCVCVSEQAMGQWVVGEWVKWVAFFDGSHGSWVTYTSCLSLTYQPQMDSVPYVAIKITV